MYSVQNSRENTHEFRQEVWQAYDRYMTARRYYEGHFKDADLGQMKAEMRAIDPELLGEERYKETDLAIVQFVLDIFYSIKRYFTSDATLARYAGRIQLLGEEFKRSRAIERVMEAFPRYVNAAPEIGLDTVQKVDEFLTYMELVPAEDEEDTFPQRFREAKGRLITELKGTVHPNLDIVFGRAVMEPQEPHLLPLTSENLAKYSHLIPPEEEEVPLSPRTEEEVDPLSTSSDEFHSCDEFFSFSNDDEEDPFLVSPPTGELTPVNLNLHEEEETTVALNAALFHTMVNQELVDIISKRILPADQIETVEFLDGYKKVKVTFKGPLEGQTDKVEAPGGQTLLMLA